VNKKNCRAFPGLVLAGTLCAGTALAHHSPAMFDDKQQVTLTGTVRVFQWTNPHCYIQLQVRDADGREEEWSLEMGAPVYLQQQGWRPATVKTGDQLTVTISPLRKQGEHKGGLLLNAIGADGKPLGKPTGKTL